MVMFFLPLLQFIDLVAYIVQADTDLIEHMSSFNEHERSCGQAVVDCSFGFLHDGIPSFQCDRESHPSPAYGQMGSDFTVKNEKNFPLH